MRAQAALLIFSLAAASAAFAQTPPASVDGRWLAATGDGIIEIYPCDGDARCGRLVWIKKPPDAGSHPPTDWHNPSPGLRDRPLCGLAMMGGFRRDGAEWIDGWIYDPESGKTYRAKMELQEDGRLHLRGYVGIPLFGETQIWTRAAAAPGACPAE